MARPYKQGVDYFAFDCHLDDKWRFIEAQFGLIGFSVVVKLLQKIYGERGYYCEWNSRVALLFSRELSLAGGNVVQEVVTAALNEGIFDKEIFQKYHILTSRGIQKRYAQAAGKRENFEIDCRYSLLNCNQKENFNAENRVFDGENLVFDVDNSQKKGKEIYSSSSSISRDAREKEAEDVFTIDDSTTRELEQQELNDLRADPFHDEEQEAETIKHIMDRKKLLGKLRLSERQMESLCELLSSDELSHYIEVLKNCIERGHQPKSPYQFILAMVKKDRQVSKR